MTPRSAGRKTLARYGERGASVRVFTERGGDLVRVQWYEGPQKSKRLRTVSFPNTAEKRQEARAFAQTIAQGLDSRRAAPAPLSCRELWSRYAEAERDHLRPKTWLLNTDGWRKWELLVGAETIAEDLGADSLARLRAELERQGLAVRTISRVVRAVKRVYSWAEEHEMLSRNRIHRYRFKVGKDKRPAKVAEYNPADFVKLMAELPMDSSRTWRAGGIIRICGLQGVRQNAVLHLQVEDIDFGAMRIRWRPEWDKLGRDWSQPLSPSTLDVIKDCLSWHQRIGYAGPWLFPKPRQGQRPDGPKTLVYTAQALWWALREAEKRAGVPHLPSRAAHGLRRMLAKNILSLTKDLKLAGDAIGDTDLRVLQESYLHVRDDELKSAFEQNDAMMRQLVDEANRNANRNTDIEAGELAGAGAGISNGDTDLAGDLRMRAVGLEPTTYSFRDPHEKSDSPVKAQGKKPRNPAKKPRNAPKTVTETVIEAQFTGNADGAE